MAPARNSPTITVKVVSARGVSSSKGADAPLTSCVTVALPLGAAEPACTETVAESVEPEFNFSTSLDVVADDAALTTLVATPVTFTLNELEKDEKVPRATATLSLAPLLGASSIAEAWLPLAAADGAEGEMGELLVSVEATGALLTEDQFEESTVLTVGVAGLYALPPSWHLAEGQGEADHLFTYDASIELAGGAAFALSGGAIAPPAAPPAEEAAARSRRRRRARARARRRRRRRRRRRKSTRRRRRRRRRRASGGRARRRSSSAPRRWRRCVRRRRAGSPPE